MTCVDCVFDASSLVCVNCKRPVRHAAIRRTCNVVDCVANSDTQAFAPRVSFGPGTEVKALLTKIGITASPDCKCNSRAAYMDKMEAEQPGWCEANIDEIVGWLRESAAERGLPFVDMAGRMLVRRAITNARRKEQARAKEAEAEGQAAGGAA